ncbi:hypothetical protein LTR65_004243 [Meristemomyces frigidus]
MFEDPANTPLVLQATVVLELRSRKKTSGTKLTELLLSPTKNEPCRYFRLGSVPTPDDVLRQTLNTRQMKQLAKSVEIGYMWALLAWFDQDERLQLSRVHAYDFDNFCVGDCSEWTPWSKIKFSNKHNYLLPYQPVSWRAERKCDLETRLKESIRNGHEDPGFGIPFLPPYTFNVFRAEDYGLGSELWPKGGIEVAVRCFGHLEDSTLGTKCISFPRDIRLEIEEMDTIESICSTVRQEINKHETQDGVCVNSGLLYNRCGDGPWKIELWVMPQLGGPQTLFRYTSGKLSGFLSTSRKIRKKDKGWPDMSHNRRQIWPRTLFLLLPTASMSQRKACRFVECDSSLAARWRTVGKLDFSHEDPSQFDGDMEDFDRWLTDMIGSEWPDHDPLIQRHRRGDLIDITYHHETENCHQMRQLHDIYPDPSQICGETICVHLRFQSVPAREFSEIRTPRVLSIAPIQVTFQFRQSEQLMYDISHFSDAVVWYDGSISLELLVTKINKAVITRLEAATSQNLRQRLLADDAVLAFEAAMSFPPSEHTWVRIDDSRLNIDTLADLLLDPEVSGNEMLVLITLNSRGADGPVHDIEGRVQRAFPAPLWNIFRVGDYVDSPRNRQPANRNNSPIPVEWPLLAWSGFDKPEKFALYTLQAYNFGGYCIGDHLLESGFLQVNGHVGHTYRGPFDGSSIPRLKRSINEYADTPHRQRQRIGTGLPILPPYCFNRYYPTVYDLGMSSDDWPEGVDIDMAVRCVRHIDMPDIDGHAMTFPKDIRFAVGHDWRADDIRNLVERELKQKAEYWDRSALFDSKGTPANARRHGEWEIELWVCPQADGELKMFRYALANEPGRDLKDFMKQALVNRRREPDRRLYVEAHIIPRENQDIISGDRSVTGTVVEMDDDEEEHEDDAEDLPTAGRLTAGGSKKTAPSGLSRGIGNARTRGDAERGAPHNHIQERHRSGVPGLGKRMKTSSM